MPLQLNDGRRRYSPPLCLLTLFLTTSCGNTSPSSEFSKAETARSNPVTNAMAACPTPIWPTMAAQNYRDSLPAVTPAQIDFKDWTARILIQQTLLDGTKPIENLY
jgi:hypothetical protein